MSAEVAIALENSSKTKAALCHKQHYLGFHQSTPNALPPNKRLMIPLAISMLKLEPKL